ncbi:hypothetical protein ACFZA1_41655 [Streptomyces filipinensis]|uniref:hypothetical protein n=1 Tax=Streptomyces filipinensis TaxID=66887 RepID=UPI0036E18BCC
MEETGNTEHGPCNEPRPLTAEEASHWFGGFPIRTDFYIGMGHIRAYAEPGPTGLHPGHRMYGKLSQFSWDSRARIVRLSDDQDGQYVQMFRAEPWARLIVEASDNSRWAAADGKIEISAPSREPGDEIGQELCEPTWFARDSLEEMYRRAAERHRVVLRMHVTHLYGATRPEDEWEEEEPRYW